MPLVKVQFKPGINKEVTVYANEGGWVNCDKTRFRVGYPEKLGGWITYPQANWNMTYNGVARSMFNWVDFNSNNLLALGTNQAFYVENRGAYYDITPIANYQNTYLGVATATTLGANPIATVTGSKLITVTDATFQSTIGTYVVLTITKAAGVTFGAASQTVTVPDFYGVDVGETITGTNIPAGTTITAVNTGASTVTISNPTAGVNAGAYVFSGLFEIVASPTATTYNLITTYAQPATGSGGTTTTVLYHINAGSATQATGTGWGIGPWGAGGWGSALSVSIPLQLWNQVNYNQDLIMALRGGAIYYWVNSVGTYVPAITINQYAGGQIKGAATQTITTGGVTAGGNAITVTNSTFIDIGSYISGTNITPGTYVTSAGGTAITLSAATLGAMSGTYNFSYSGLTAPNEVYQIVTNSVYGFVVAMGSTPYSPIVSGNVLQQPQFDPMRVRWSDQSLPAEWTPTTYNQSGEQRLSNGSFIIGSVNTRQEILIWTDQSLYSMQYIGPPYTFGFTSLMDNISCMSPNCMVTIGGVTYWMGIDKFYIYAGTVNTLPCTLRKFIFQNINFSQTYQIVAGYNERYNEIWWLYPSLNSQTNDSYVVYNYMENFWYYGTLNRTFWFDSSLRQYPMAAYGTQSTYLSLAINSTANSFQVINATTYPNTLQYGATVIGVLQIDNELMTYTGITGNVFLGVTRGAYGTTAASHVIYSKVLNAIPNQVMFHELGTDDQSYSTVIGTALSSLQPINSYIESADFAIGDGQLYGFVWRALPDFNFNIGAPNGSTVTNPQILLTVYPRQNSGTTYQSNVDQPTVTGSSSSPVEQFTGQIYTRVRGRQLAFQINSSNQGVFWQMGAMRFDIRPDG